MPYVSEAPHSSREESGKGPRPSWLRQRTLMNCLLFMGSAYLTVYGSVVFCSDGPIEPPASSRSTAQTAAVARLTKRPATVADSIQMTRLGDPSYTDGAPSKGIVAKFSPDGKHFVVILKKGNLEGNTNEYSLVLFQTAEAFQLPAPRVLVSLASSSNRPAINNVLWLDDNDTILFLGENPGEQTALYSLKCSSKELKKLTTHATYLTAFVSTASGGAVVFSAISPVSTLLTDSVARNGIAVTSEGLNDLIRGSVGGQELDDKTLWMQQFGRGTETRIATLGTVVGLPMSLSPDGAHLLLQTLAPHVPDTWRQYDDKYLQLAMGSNTGAQGSAPVAQYELIDMGTGASQVLVDAPIGGGFGSDMAWSADSKSVVVSNIYLPLNVEEASELALRKAHTFLVEFKIPSRQFVKISDEDLRLLSWDSKTGDVACDVGKIHSFGGKTTPKAYFHKSGETWSRSTAPEQAAATPLPDIFLDEDMNTPPHMVAVDPATGRRSTLMALNPQFQSLALARVEEITWEAGHRTEVKGGLYWPPDYVPGKKYPLVIQTHRWTPDRFWMDGPWATAYSAQALAGKGFFVLQVGELTDGEAVDWHIVETINEATGAMAMYESAIDNLDRKGLIDRNRVGITGFSRSFWYVTYTLTHSKHPFAAAALADGVDFSYFQYMTSSPSPMLDDFEGINGAPPFGKGLRTWLERSPAFLMDKIETPLRIQTLYPESLLADWHWYLGLSRLGKPVEMIYIPGGTHILEKPWERLTSQQGNVDWFSFWLKGEEDPDPAKSEQYARWRKLRKQQEATEATQKPH
jgi:hypothetical protein